MNTTSTPNHVFVLMGVSGSGKSAVANAVAYQLQAAFLDGDFLHPRANIEKMSEGHPLNDDDRRPWLQSINDAAFAMQGTNSVSLIVCSALKKVIATSCAKGIRTSPSSICRAISIPLNPACARAKATSSSHRCW